MHRFTKKTAFFSLIAFMAVSMVSCKYDEGPCMSLRSKTERLSNKWKVEYAYETPAGSSQPKDVTKWYNDWAFEMEIVNNNTWTSSVTDTSGTYTTEGLWDFMSDKEEVRFKINSPQQSPDRFTYKVLKLKEKEIWFQHDQDTLTLELRMIEAGSSSE